METVEQSKLLSELDQFTGTTQYFRHFTGGLYTDGVQYLAEHGKCYWLLDAIFSYARKEEFQLWELTVKNKAGFLTMKEDSDQPVKIRQKFGYTDFPLDYIKLYLIDGVLILPSEY